ncbi:MAG: acyl-CoA synthetase (AMP-forming)/AMP-acid ligase II [Haloarculaceae archaeon]|jgi:acyl-CoA synthetase (AMP-forming)/AMP-acid ligase II
MTDADAPPRRLRTVTDALEQKVSEAGEETFIQFEGEALSYAALDRRANAIANALADRGVEPDDTVCLFLYNSLPYVTTYFALAKLGAIAAPIDTRFTGETLSVVLSETGASTILIDAQTRDAYEAVQDDVANITTEYFVGAQPSDRPYRDFESLLTGDESTPPDVTVTETDTLSVTFVQRYATEEPKGVCLPHYSYINTGWEVAANLFGFDADDHLFTTLPLYSIFTFQLGVMGALLGDARITLAGPFDPDRFWQQVDHHGATIILYLGRMLSVLYNQSSERVRRDNPVDLAIGHGFGFDTDETLIKNFEDRFDITVLEGYGVTQTATIATYNTPEDRRIGSSGRPVSYATVQIVDDNDWPVPRGESGEIVVRPTRPNTMLQGYLDDHEGTVELTRNQWIHSGDIGYLDEDGYLHFVASRENSIYRGRIAGRISALEIESVIDSQPDVRKSAVVGVENEEGNEAIKAVVVPREGTDLNPVDICQHCEQQLPYVKVPRYVTIRSELPRNPSGKIRKHALRSTTREETWDRESGYELSR